MDKTKQLNSFITTDLAIDDHTKYSPKELIQEMNDLADHYSSCLVSRDESMQERDIKEFQFRIICKKKGGGK